MEHNFFFRSKEAARKYVLFAILSQTIGPLVFTPIAFLLWRAGVALDQLVIVLAGCITIVVLGSTHLVYKKDFRLLRAGTWPLDNLSHVQRSLRSFLGRARAVATASRKTQRAIEQELIEVKNVYRRAESRGTTQLLVSINETYEHGLQIRKDVLATIAEAEAIELELKGHIELVNRDLREQQRALGYFGNQLSSLVRSNEYLSREQREIANWLSQTKGQLGVT